ncbi:MAG: 4-hydroxy-3-methylbut-2-enyl diphosphate reductase [Bacteroidales bacterium]|jgi:4-hydroxy-3-methylbut-2-enyl diphosphate reductase|nr:4-hydroxy-3-methylbut-2-enyl diphosphate reductase [Bacteroidales bacterium]
MNVVIDPKSGFCFGVTQAVQAAENALAAGPLYCLGDIVHNQEETARLKAKGLKSINHATYFAMRDCRVLLRAHGEPPSTYEYAAANRIHLIDATCPIVLTLQMRVSKAWQRMKAINGQVVIYGKKGHAEVTGLVGQTEGRAIIVEQEDDLRQLDYGRPIAVFSQTTQSPERYTHIAQLIEACAKAGYTAHNTICRQMGKLGDTLDAFARQHDVVIFVGGAISSNAKYLFGICQQANARSWFISSAAEIRDEWFVPTPASVGICGATSTPRWLMEEVAQKLREK